MALAALADRSEPEAKLLRREYNVLLDSKEMRDLSPKVFGQMRIRAIKAEREGLLAMRRTREIGDNAYRTLEGELDWAEGNARRRGKPYEVDDDMPGP